MEFRRPIQIVPSPIRITHQSLILTMGSCFSNVIGEKLKENKFKVKVNPFGVIFNPVSIFRVLEISSRGINEFRNSFIQSNGIWYSYDLHSQISYANKEELDNKTNELVSDIHEYLKKCQIITITFGTAFAYRLKKNNQIVANCHKIPAVNFTKELLSTEEILTSFKNTYSKVKTLNPSVKFILTVSPVRHLKDGIEENQISKSICRLACHKIKEELSDVEYFPAYEIMMDDLRDYRFYKEDMIHPTEVAEGYIWEKFLERYTSKETEDILNEWSKLKKALEHKPFHSESTAHQTFLKETMERLKKLSTVIEVTSEIKLIDYQIKK